jgi:hypothetical protein
LFLHFNNLTQAHSTVQTKLLEISQSPNGCFWPRLCEKSWSELLIVRTVLSFVFRGNKFQITASKSSSQHSQKDLLSDFRLFTQPRPIAA